MSGKCGLAIAVVHWARKKQDWCQRICPVLAQYLSTRLLHLTAGAPFRAHSGRSAQLSKPAPQPQHQRFHFTSYLKLPPHRDSQNRCSGVLKQTLRPGEHSPRAASLVGGERRSVRITTPPPPVGTVRGAGNHLNNASCAASRSKNRWMPFKYFCRNHACWLSRELET